MKDVHQQAGLPIPGIAHIAQPYYFGRSDDDRALSEEEFGMKSARALQEKIDELGAENVAAFIGEPIQGAGGVIIPPPNYWREIQRICDKHDILLVVDEVICGFGRTGEWFGSDTFEIAGDLMTVAKGLSSGYQPISALMVGDKVAAALHEHDGEFSHGYTYSGHPVACAVALENLRILRDERIIETARDTTMSYLESQLKTLASHRLVGEVRIKGFVGAIELVADKKDNRRFDSATEAGVLFRETCFDNGLVMRAVGDTMVLAPPLVISRAEIDELVDKAARSLDEVAAKLLG